MTRARTASVCSRQRSRFAQQPVLELVVIVEMQTLQELAAQQFDRFPPAFFCFQLQQGVDFDGYVW
jgi:hypothetical protein